MDVEDNKSALLHLTQSGEDVEMQIKDEGSVSDSGGKYSIDWKKRVKSEFMRIKHLKKYKKTDELKVWGSAGYKLYIWLLMDKKKETWVSRYYLSTYTGMWSLFWGDKDILEN